MGIEYLRTPAPRGIPTDQELDHLIALLQLPFNRDSDKPDQLTLLKAWLHHFRVGLTDNAKVADVQRILGYNTDDDITKPLFDVITTPIGPLPCKERPATTRKSTHKSSNTGMFGNARIFAKFRSYGPPIAEHIKPILKDLEDCITGPYTRFPHLIRETEADVDDSMRILLLEPCRVAINKLIRFWYRKRNLVVPPLVRLTAQPVVPYQDEDGDGDYSLQLPAMRKLMPDAAGTTIRVDHAFYLPETKRGKVTKLREYVVLVEDKAPGTVNIEEMKQFTIKKGMCIDKASGNVKKQMPQILKYDRGYKCKFSVLTDSVTFMAMEWEDVPESEEKTSHEQWKKLHYWNMEANTKAPVKRAKQAAAPKASGPEPSATPSQTRASQSKGAPKTSGNKPKRTTKKTGVRGKKRPRTAHISIIYLLIISLYKLGYFQPPKAGIATQATAKAEAAATTG